MQAQKMQWLPAQPVIAEYDEAFSTIPQGARVLVLQGTTGSTARDRAVPLDHVPVFAAAKHLVFAPTIFSGAAVGLSVTPQNRSYLHFAPYPEFSREMARFDYVLTVWDPKFSIPKGVRTVQLAEGRSYKLYRVEAVR